MTLSDVRVITPHQEVWLSLPLKGFAGDNQQVTREATFIERAPAGLIPASHDQYLPELSSFRPNIASPEGLVPVHHTDARRKTSVKSSQRRSPSNTPEPPETPSYTRPLHLFDTAVVVGLNGQGDELLQDISIYKTIHGEEWKRNALCSHCFQNGGTCNRVMTHGYEVCGRDKSLDSHYWEPTANPNY